MEEREFIMCGVKLIEMQTCRKHVVLSHVFGSYTFLYDIKYNLKSSCTLSPEVILTIALIYLSAGKWTADTGCQGA